MMCFICKVELRELNEFFCLVKELGGTREYHFCMTCTLKVLLKFIDSYEETRTAEHTLPS